MHAFLLNESDKYYGALIQYDKYTTGNAWMHYDLYIQKHHEEWTNIRFTRF